MIRKREAPWLHALDICSLPFEGYNEGSECCNIFLDKPRAVSRKHCFMELIVDFTSKGIVRGCVG